MFAKLKELIFPCDTVMKELMTEHSRSVEKNQDAHDRFMKACSDNFCIRHNFSNQNHIENSQR